MTFFFPFVRAGSEAEGTAEDEAGEGGVPHFWMQCMLHHEALRDVVW